MPIMPSTAFVAQALYAIGAETEWDEAPLEEQNSHMQLAKVAIGSILSWQRAHKPDGSNRYMFEPTKDEDDVLQGFAIYDKKMGSSTVLGVIHDPLLAQQVVDDLNRREPSPKGPIYGD